MPCAFEAEQAVVHCTFCEPSSSRKESLVKFITQPMLVVVLAATGCAFDATEASEETQAESAALSANCIRYEDVPLPDTAPGYDLFGPTGVAKHGVIYGGGLDCDDNFEVCSFDLLKLDRNGNFTKLVDDFAVNEVGENGDSGGCKLYADETAQAAIAHPNGHVELIPRLPGEVTSCISQMSDGETALVQSFDADSVQTDYVYRNGHVYPITLEGADIRDINDKGTLAGIITTGDGDRAFRYESRTQTLTLLEPIGGDPNSWGMGLDQQGEVLGYSFFFSEQERIGKWNKKDRFETFFVEGTPEVPPVSNQLIWNDKEFVVVSDADDSNTYVIPRPGVRLNLADLVEGGVVPPRLFAYSINENADFLAQSVVDFTIHLYVRTN